MSIYRIADLDIKIIPKYPQTGERLAPYAVQCERYDIDASVTHEEIDERCKQSSRSCAPYEAESVLIFTKLCNAVLDDFGGFFFHSSCVELDGEAYVFSAESGTGKSTHTALWKKHFGSRAAVINDDKPIIRRCNGKFCVYGTPWMGKSNVGKNTKAPVRAVYILQRAEKNSVKRVKPSQVIGQLLDAAVLDYERSRMEKLLGLFDEFFSTVPLFLLSCNMEENAAETAYNAVSDM